MAHKIDHGDGQRWDRWNKGLTTAVERSVEAGRRFIEESFEDVFGIPKPIDKTYRQVGLKIAYHLQEQDCKAKGIFAEASQRLLQRFQAAAAYGHLGHLSANDPWNLDRIIQERKGTPENLKPREKSNTRIQIESLMDELGAGKIELVCGDGTEQATTFLSKKPKTVQVSANKKGTTTYNLQIEKDRNTLYWRLWRWSRKEDIFV